MKRAEKKKCLLPTFYSTNDEEMRFERILPEKKNSKPNFTSTISNDFLPRGWLLSQQLHKKKNSKEVIFTRLLIGEFSRSFLRFLKHNKIKIRFVTENSTRWRLQ